MKNRTFQELVKKAKEKNMSDLISSEFEVSLSTIDRWESGIAVPHQKTKEIIEKFILRKLEQK